MLTRAQRTFFLVEQIVLPFGFNLGFNAGLGWYVFREHAPVPLFGDPSVGADLLGMLFFLPFLTCVIGTPVVKRAARLGKVEPLAILPDQHWLLRYMPASVWARAFAVGLACVVAFGPATLASLALLGQHSFTLMHAIWFKGVYSAVLAGLVTPPLAAYALSQPALPAVQAN